MTKSDVVLSRKGGGEENIKETRNGDEQPDPDRTERTARAESTRIRHYFASFVSGFVTLVVGIVISGGGRGCSETGPSFVSPFPSSFPSLAPSPLRCVLGESAIRSLRAFCSKTSSSVDSPKFLQHPLWAEAELDDPGFSRIVVVEDRRWGQQREGGVGWTLQPLRDVDVLKLSATATDSQQVRTRTTTTRHPKIRSENVGVEDRCGPGV